MTGNPVSERDPITANREARAEQYLGHDLKGQRDWYSGKASLFKQRHQYLSLFVIVAGAATAFVQVFGQHIWVSVVTALLGALVATAEGWQRIARYNEAWLAYRVASERMKREQRLYVNSAGEYRELDDEDVAFLHFVENIEAIIAEEQQIYWQGRGSQPPTGKSLGDGRQTAPLKKVTGGADSGG